MSRHDASRLRMMFREEAMWRPGSSSADCISGHIAESLPPRGDPKSGRRWRQPQVARESGARRVDVPARSVVAAGVCLGLLRFRRRASVWSASECSSQEPLGTLTPWYVVTRA